MKFRSIFPVFVTSVFFGVIFFVQVPSTFAATFIVNSTLDSSDVLPGDAVCDDGSGNCTLRGAIEETNALAGADTVNFNIGGGGVQTFTPNSPFPQIIDTVSIDGTTQPNYANTPLIEISGSNIIISATGLDFDVNSNNVVKGLCIHSFTGFGLVFNQSTDFNTVSHNFIGVDPSGTIFQPNTLAGIYLNDSMNNVLNDNLVSASVTSIFLYSSSNNRIQGNKIGTNISGTAGFQIYPGSGIRLYNNSLNNIIGGANLGEGNLISSFGTGIEVSNHSDNSSIQGNYLGTDITGTQPIANSMGIYIADSINTYIGGANLGEGNLISSSTGVAININFMAQNTHVYGNKIGTDLTGTVSLSNYAGIWIFSDNNIIGGTNLGEGNLISGNNQDGIGIYSNHNLIQGNKVGTDITGTSAISNYIGINIHFSQNNSITSNNLISGNTFCGIFGSDISQSSIQGNKVGTDINGNTSLPNANGIFLSYSYQNIIGGLTNLERNIISGNTSAGITIMGSSTNTTVQGNFIGTNNSATGAVPNGFGVVIDNAQSNTVGGSVLGSKNIISGNFGDGIAIQNNASQNIVEGNNIGTDISGTLALSNLYNGIHFNGSSPQNTIRNNLISGNKQTGVFIDSNSNNNQIFGNKIGTNLAGTASLQNQAGIGIVSSNNNQIGSSNPLESNLISGNLVHGIFLKQSDYNAIEGNIIGTDISGVFAIGNGNTGVFVIGGNNNHIGGNTLTEGNLISGNGKSGIQLGFNSTFNQISENKIGTDINGNVSIFNKENGILINENSNQNNVSRNLISGNQQDGIFISTNANNNIVQKNLIGTNDVGASAVPNGFAGIRILDASSNIIGGTNVNEGNTIAFNKEAGVTVIQRTGTAIKNPIRFNSIFSNNTLGIDLGNNAVTGNDNKDPDTGANMLQNYPKVTGALRVNANSLQVSSTFNSNPNTTFQVDIYASPTADPSGFGEGKRYLGSTTVITNAQGNVPPALPLVLAVPVQIGEYVSMTATDPTGNTSEFSNAKVVN